MILEDLDQAVSRRNALSAELMTCDGEIAELIAQAVVSGLTVESALCKMKPLIPRQRTRRSGGRERPGLVPAEFIALSRNRAWEVLSSADREEGCTSDELLSSLRHEGHVHLSRSHVDGWITYWERLGRVRRLADCEAPAYAVVDDRLMRPLAEAFAGHSTFGDPVPYLLRAVLTEVEASGKGCLYTGTIAAALGVSAYELGATLCPLLRSVGVHRPGDGRVREMPGGLLAPGFTEECLRTAVAAFEVRAEGTTRSDGE
ncbi:hypothetical protein [Streptomyces olindensis]|uniref:hypothetical protein n=1 Tax=Streptomyces olindensis TaxID=358823 RepID=UPI0033D5D4A7